MTTQQQPVAQPADTSAVAVAGVSRTAASRDGKVLISGFFDPHVRQRLKVLSAITARTQEDLLGEALALLFKAHDQSGQAFTPAAAGTARRAVARR